MPRRITTLQFVKHAKEVHGNKYDYSKSVYVDVYTRLVIICKKHGEILTVPKDHLYNKSGCAKCAYVPRRNTAKRFIKRAKQIHKGLYQYDKVVYETARTKVIVTCSKHGDFLVAPNNHTTNKSGCPKCLIGGHTLTTSEFIEKAHRVHKEQYQYTNIVYKNSYTKVAITCLTHGDFQQKPSNHLSGNGCRKCAIERNKITSKGGFCDAYFTAHPEQKSVSATLYITLFSKNADNFIKVGITTGPTNRRFRSFPYNVQLLLKKEATLFEAYTKEQFILSACKNDKYIPNEKFDGYTECLKNHPKVLTKIKNILGAT